MSGIKNHEKQFSLKDELFNKAKVKKISNELKRAYTGFDQKQFETDVLQKFPELELMERIMWIRDCVRAHLPNDYKNAVQSILKSLPPELDPEKTDNDFGEFIYAPYGYLVAEYGCTKADLAFSLKALETLTKRFSMEGPIRTFLNTYPAETMKAVTRWSQSKHYHVRRLASEGTRPFLPWACRIGIDPKSVVPILDTLHADPTRYVTRSVANHMNDLSKIEPALVVKTLKRWQKADQQGEKEMQFIVKHSLRTLVKEGNMDALKLLGFKAPQVAVANLKLSPKTIKTGQSLKLTFDLEAKGAVAQNLVIDYIIHFKKARGHTAPKVYKISQVTLKPGEKIAIEKKHPLKLMSTRALYPGIQTLELQINGQSFGKIDFKIVES